MDDAFIADFLRAHDRELDALRAAVGKPLDLSYESLDILEDHYRGVLKQSAEMSELQGIHPRLARYVGATLASHTKGKWVLSEEKTEPTPAIAVPGLGKRTFEPLSPWLAYRRLRVRGLVREHTERWDLALRRAALARVIAEAPKVAERLAADVGELTGQRAKLDGSAKSVQSVEDALQALAAPTVPNERRRAVQDRAIGWLGALAAEAAGKATWTLVEDPKNMNFGELQILGWAPGPTVRTIGKKSPQGVVQKRLQEAIAKAKKK